MKMAKFKTPAIKEWDFMTVWSLKNLWRFVWKKLLEGKALVALLSNIIFHGCTRNFFQKFKLEYKLTL